MNNIIITVLSDDINKSKNFAKYLAGDTLFEVIQNTNEDLVLKYKQTRIQAIKPHLGQRGHRHHKIYVDSASPRAVELTLEMFQYKVLSLHIPTSKFELEVKRPIEFLDFEREIKRYNKLMENFKEKYSNDYMEIKNNFIEGVE